jgi:hypothetical protein
MRMRDKSVQLHPALAELRTELEYLGLVVVCHGDYICVRLPLVASVRIHLHDGRLRLEPRFGPWARGTSLVVTPTIGMIGLGTVASSAGLGAPTIVAGIAAIFLVLYDVCRLVLTEGCMTRLQLLWSTRPPPREGVVQTGDPLAIAEHRTAASLAAPQMAGGTVRTQAHSGERVR